MIPKSSFSNNIKKQVVLSGYATTNLGSLKLRLLAPRGVPLMLPYISSILFLEEREIAQAKHEQALQEQAAKEAQLHSFASRKYSVQPLCRTRNR